MKVPATLAVSLLTNIKRQMSYEHLYTLELVANFTPPALLIRQYFIRQYPTQNAYYSQADKYSDLIIYLYALF